MKALQKVSKFLSDYTSIVVIAIAVVTFFLPSMMGYRIGFQSGQGIDQKHCKRTYAAEEDKVIHNSRNHNLYDRYIRIPAVEKS